VSDDSDGSKPVFKELEKKYGTANTSNNEVNNSFYKHTRSSSVYSLIEPPSAKDRSSLQSFNRANSIVDHDDPLLLPLQIKAASKIYIMDFGLAEYYRDMKTNVHKPRSLRFPCGTPRFMSRNTHMCERKFIIIFYFILFYFFHFYIYLIILLYIFIIIYLYLFYLFIYLY